MASSNELCVDSSVAKKRQCSAKRRQQALPSSSSSQATMSTSTSSSSSLRTKNIVNHFWCLAAVVCGLMMFCLMFTTTTTEAAPPARYNAEALENFISHIDAADPEAYANIKRSASPFFAWGGKRAAAPAQQAFFHWGGKRAAKPAANPAASAAAANYYDLWNYYRTYLPFVMEESSKRAAAPRAAQFFSWGGR